MQQLVKYGIPLYIAAAGGSYYVVKHIQQKKQDRQAKGGEQAFSDPSKYANRKAVFDDIADEYDRKINMDELVMGMKLLRRFLIAKNAHGDVLEVSTGTGRNLRYYKWNGTNSDGSRDQTKEGVDSLALSDASESMLSVLAEQHNLTCHSEENDSVSRCTDQEGHSIALSCNRAESLPFSDDTFDTGRCAGIFSAF